MFVSFVKTLLVWKNQAQSNHFLVGALVRQLSGPSEGRPGGKLHAKLFKGMVLATRIAATVFRTPSATNEAVVSEEQSHSFFIHLGSVQSLSVRF